MRTDDESRNSNLLWDAVEADRRAVEEHVGAVEEHLLAVMRDIRLVPAGTAEATQLRTEAVRLREEQQRLSDETGRIEREMERKRIALQILAVVVPWRDSLPDMDPEECDLFRVRANALLNYLDVAVRPYPDLQDALAAARSELAWGQPTIGSQTFH